MSLCTYGSAKSCIPPSNSPEQLLWCHPLRGDYLRFQAIRVQFGILVALVVVVMSDLLPPPFIDRTAARDALSLAQPTVNSPLCVVLVLTVCVACVSVGYVLGLGDRHVQNILVDCKTAELVHIDLGL